MPPTDQEGSSTHLVMPLLRILSSTAVDAQRTLRSRVSRAHLLQPAGDRGYTMVSSAEEVIANPGVWEVNTLICLNTNPYYDKSPWSLSKLVPQPFRRVGSRETHSSATPSRARRRARSYPRSRAKESFVEFPPRRPAWSPLRLPPFRTPLEGVSTKYERTVAYFYICGIAEWSAGKWSSSAP